MDVIQHVMSETISTHIQLPISLPACFHQLLHLFIRQWFPQHLLPRHHILRTRTRQERAGLLDRFNPFFISRGWQKRVKLRKLLLAGWKGLPSGPWPGQPERHNGWFTKSNRLHFRSLRITVHELKWSSGNNIRQPIFPNLQTHFFHLSILFVMGKFRPFLDFPKRGVVVRAYRVLGIFPRDRGTRRS
uniref:Uncharacterized protein n=1 Tax=Opuntia streptacantha TaxID=393608 RepID=A0A7C8Z357_OPUST